MVFSVFVFFKKKLVLNKTETDWVSELDQYFTDWVSELDQYFTDRVSEFDQHFNLQYHC